jgi:DNA mismatch repair protein MutS
MEITRNSRAILREISDIERIIMRISMRKSIPRDLLALHMALEAAKKLYPTMKELSLSNEMHDFDIMSNKIESIIKPDAPNSLAEGRFIKKSYNARLTELYDLLENNNEVIEGLKLEYQVKTGIDSLKICKNNLIGIFIEITPKNLSKMTDSEFIHKQTTLSSVRFTTERLRALEIDMMNAERLAIILEQEIFWELCGDIMKLAISLRQLAHNLSIFDVYCSFAHLAKEHNYVRPIMEQSTSLLIEGGRHVTVEQNVQNFVPNNCDLNHNQRLWLITGPNMAGKSTFLRQNALIIILAQMGSFIPASYAKIGVVDRLFSRIGASDDLAKGQSTFMVEMLETAMILAQSTENSFIILDEIGRGTSTYDGVSIAWGCLEHIHNILKCRSLFATHYHELTSLSGALAGLRNHTISIKESNGEVLFLHKIIPGIADKSYGIHVAELAGIPKSVIKRAYEVLKNLEKNSKSNQKNMDNLIENNYSLFDVTVAKEGKIALALADIKPDELSPKEALETLYELKKMVVEI